MGGKVKVQAIDVVKMDKFKYVGQLYKTVHKGGEEESAGRMKMRVRGHLGKKDISKSEKEDL